MSVWEGKINVPNVLLVDDVDETLESLSMVYGLFNEVEIVGVAHNSAELWYILSTKHVDIISLDIELGHENGIELCSQIHERYPKILIIMCSIEASEVNRMKAKQAGASLFLAKPVSRDNIREVLQAHKKRAENAREDSAISEDWINDLFSAL
jgi:DNA-binding NarL/FixJ family response regulator